MRHGRKVYQGETSDPACCLLRQPRPRSHQAGHDTPEYYAKLKELDGYVAVSSRPLQRQAC